MKIFLLGIRDYLYSSFGKTQNILDQWMSFASTNKNILYPSLLGFHQTWVYQFQGKSAGVHNTPTVLIVAVLIFTMELNNSTLDENEL